MFYIVGNGPSVSEAMIKSLPEKQWLGMNSAYKFWNEINKYPKYYCCLDPVVMLSQAEGIIDLMSRTDIEVFFLHEEILKRFPKLGDEKKVVLRDNFFTKASQKEGVSLLALYKQTTGALAARFVIDEGFRDLMLIGVDCNYVEILREASRLEGHELVISNQIKRNPNYFFSNYQTKGDRYQIPNPEVHSGNLHLQSFVALNNEIHSTKKDLSIKIGVDDSLLNKYSIFPFFDFWRSIGYRRLQCVAVPLTPREIEPFIGNLQYWLDARFCPSIYNQLKGTVLHIFVDTEYQQEVYDRLQEGLNVYSGIYSYFDDVKITFCCLPQSVNFYNKIRDGRRLVTKSGPNIFFLAIMAHCRQYEFTFQMESDCVPIKAGWLDALDNECQTSGCNSWIIGPAYFGPTRLRVSYRGHINGNAIYRTGDRNFQDCLDTFFIPVLQELISNGLNDLAYDTMLSVALFNIETFSDDHKVLLLKMLEKLKHTSIILNVGGGVETQDHGLSDLCEVINDNKMAFLIHGRWATTIFYSAPIRWQHLFQTPVSGTRFEFPLSHLWAGNKVAKKFTNKGFGDFDITISDGEGEVPLYLHYIPPLGLAGQSVNLQFRAQTTSSVRSFVSCGCAAVLDRSRLLPMNSTFEIHNNSIAMDCAILSWPADIKYLCIVMTLDLDRIGSREKECVIGVTHSSFSGLIHCELEEKSLSVELLDGLGSERISQWESFVVRFNAHLGKV